MGEQNHFKRKKERFNFEKGKGRGYLTSLGPEKVEVDSSRV